MSIIDAIDKLREVAGTDFDDAFPPCRECGRMLLMGDGAEEPPMGPICYGCITTQAVTLRTALNAITSALDVHAAFPATADRDARTLAKIREIVETV